MPSGNVFITRRCRKLAQKLYVVYRHESRKKISSQIGLHVPRDVFERAESDFEAKRARIGRRLWRVLDEKYPQMPLADKNEVHRLILSECPSVIGKSVLVKVGIRVYAYVWDQYTPFKSLTLYDKNRDTEPIKKAHLRVEDILASWRGERLGVARVECRWFYGPRYIPSEPRNSEAHYRPWFEECKPQGKDRSLASELAHVLFFSTLKA